MSSYSNNSNKTLLHALVALLVAHYVFYRLVVSKSDPKQRAKARLRAKRRR